MRAQWADRWPLHIHMHVHIYIHIYIDPLTHSPLVSGSLVKRSRQSMKLVPLNGSPPIPTHVDWPRPTAVVCATASYVSVPERETMPGGGEEGMGSLIWGLDG